jgi:transcriptional regulator with XRE-family HTH domain
MKPKLIGQRISTYRHKKGWSQEELSFEAGLSRNTIGRLERGEYIPPLPVLNAIEKALGIPEDSLFASAALPGQRVLLEYDLRDAGIDSDAKIVLSISSGL